MTVAGADVVFAVADDAADDDADAGADVDVIPLTRANDVQNAVHHDAFAQANAAADVSFDFVALLTYNHCCCCYCC